MASFIFAERCGNRVQPDGAAGIFLDDCQQQIAVDVVEAVLVDAQHRQRVARHAQRDVALRAHFRVIAHAPQQAVGNARSAAAAPRDFRRAVAAPCAMPRIFAERSTMRSRSSGV